MKTGSYFPKSSFGDVEVGKNPVWKKLAWVRLIKHIGFKNHFFLYMDLICFYTEIRTYFKNLVSLELC